MKKRFLHLFPSYRKMEYELASYKKTFDTTRNDLIAMKQQINSDANLIESLNRYIKALEGKSEMQAELITELKQRLKTLLVKPQNKKAPNKKKRSQ